MHEHWREFGYPVHVQLANFLGTNKPKRTTHHDDDGPGDMDAILAMLENEPGATVYG